MERERYPRLGRCLSFVIDKGLLGPLPVEVESSFFRWGLRYQVGEYILGEPFNESAADVVVPVGMTVHVHGPRRTGRRMSEFVGVGRHRWRSHLVLFRFYVERPDVVGTPVVSRDVFNDLSLIHI